MKVVYLWEAGDIKVGTKVEDSAGAHWLLAYEPTDNGQDYLMVSMSDGLAVSRSSSAAILAQRMSNYGGYRPLFEVKL